MSASEASVGVIVPCFNQGEFAAECIRSLRAQTHSNWFAILIDDASDDGISRQACIRQAGPRVDVHTLETNLGRSRVRNHALGLLPKSNFVLILDCDDFLDTKYVETLLDALGVNPRAGLAYGTLHHVSQQGSSLATSWPTREWSESSMYLENVIPGPGAMFRRSALEQSAGWRASFTECSGEDYDLWLQVVELGWMPLWVRHATYCYRQHAQSFLAIAPPGRELAVDLRILRCHASAIRKQGVLARYLAQKIVPSFTRAVRRLDFGQVADILRFVLPAAPLSFAAQVGHFYRSRGEARLRALRRGPRSPE